MRLGSSSEGLRGAVTLRRATLWSALWCSAMPWLGGCRSTLDLDDLEFVRDEPTGYACSDITFRDTFDDPALSQWNALDYGASTLRTLDGKLVMSPATNNGRGDLQSRELIDMTGRMLLLEVLPAAQGRFGLNLLNVDGTAVEIENGSTGDLVLNHVDQLVTIPYEPVRQRYWRLVESAGQVAFDTSTDQLTWTHEGSVALTSSVRAVTVSFGIWETNPGYDWSFDNFAICAADAR